jgi:hypothetical protein
MENEVNCDEESFINTNNKQFFKQQNSYHLECDHSNRENSFKITSNNSEKFNQILKTNDSNTNKLLKQPNGFWIKIKKNLYLMLALLLLLYLYYVYMFVILFLIFC